ncbi:glycosyltransferase family 1 protein [Trichoderma citrinoviride]|uniref:Glycosyltransferase family 1 protein n=1 Tax=Trichoderma citrinoviride TaxID=58853 RepID=A0A2T4B076_9HYPO|nr:glycosyltransferase family 1 protein [Trichoderma citrinoviride]PTB62710.1 glycosyltransferase family 1 protein [Trichoderma citrinoviride]
MLLSRTRSNAAGHIAIDDGLKKQVTSPNVGDDGRFELCFHEDAASLATWCKNLQETSKRVQTGPCAGRGICRRKSTGGFCPPLNIAMLIVGSRGDVQPFIPIAQLLSKPPYGHRVRICTHPAFKDFVESQGVEFFNIGGDPEALMSYMVRNPGLVPNRKSVRAGDIGKRRAEMWEIINRAWRGCIEAGNGMGDPVRATDVENVEDLFLADAIIANPPSIAHIHCAEKLGIPLHMVFTMPFSPTTAFPHPLASMNYSGADAKTANYLSFIMMELLMWQGLGDLINKFRRQKLGLDPISVMWGFQLLSRLRVPFTYLWPESLIPKPPDWGSHIEVVGYSFLPLAKSYKPPPDLTEFLEKGPKPIYIGFGSIVVEDPDAFSDLIFKAVKIAGVRAIISRGWSGVGDKCRITEDVYLIDNCPHDWLFQQVSAVVHHGGAGTTAAGIAAGRPTVIVPFFGDQPFWGQMIARSGAGPDPIPFKSLTAENLAESISVALMPSVQEAAKRMAEDIADENGAEATAKSFQDQIGLDQFECEICPGRLATHRHKKSGTRLSGLAVACLVDRGLIQPPELELIRRKNWYVDEGAEHPLVGLAAAFTGPMMDIATATFDYSHALRYRPKHTKLEDRRPSWIDPWVADKVTIGSVGSDGTSPNRRINPTTFSTREMELYAHKIARKSIKTNNADIDTLVRQPSLYDKQKAAWHARERGRNGHLFYLTRATGRYAVELTKVGLKTPVAFFYNIANGFHNYPSCGYAGVEVRRRDQIVDLETGLVAAGKEFTLGIWDAFSGVVIFPYKSVHEEGAKGLGKGVWRGSKGFFSNLGASAFGLPGYTLKGLEKELQKHHLTNCKAEIILIRLRQGIEAFRRATPQERDEVIRRWNARNCPQKQP